MTRPLLKFRRWRVEFDGFESGFFHGVGFDDVSRIMRVLSVDGVFLDVQSLRAVVKPFVQRLHRLSFRVVLRSDAGFVLVRGFVGLVSGIYRRKRLLHVFAIHVQNGFPQTEKRRKKGITRPAP